MKSHKSLKILIFICVGMISVGVLFSGIGFLMGGGKYIGNGYVIGENSLFSGENETKTFEAKNVSNIKVHTGVSVVNFKEGDKFAVEYCYDTAIGEPEIKVEGDTLIYEDRLYGRNKEKFFGIGNIANRVKRIPIYVTIYYPQGTTFKDVEIINDMGNLNIGDFNADKLVVEADMGEIDVRRINSRSINIDADLGDIRIEDFIGDKTEITADMGNIDMRGELRGKMEISCDMGSVDVSSSLSKKDYNYEIGVDMGSVSIDSENVKNSYSLNNGAENLLDIDCSMGSVELSFDEV